MNKWVLLEHKVYTANSFAIHYDFLVQNGIDCLTWKFSKLPLLNKAPIEVCKQPNHRLVWLSRIEHELSDNRGFVKRIDHGIFKSVSDKLDSEYYRFILDGELLYGLFEISGNSCRLSKNY
ncbi:hypothetical protein HA150_00340 [Prochlorococcus marinus XMU1414]|uniref:Uncharacterized protein n=1 Tax=Prochlorococcus marinus XMU1424 TaxID=2774497 RepID=A0A9D9C134_PROMR|nr:hypothetical protein [Prochlorococcus marinus]MBO8227346.1 hypothetical protein [Prochlorococcus marinus XMU1414]MBW3044861.1 hypothetical protein [Prochlorococcus marinus str. MU1414]MCR8532876.1 hypothetical protein [Prochlorococcus marinus XMU1420]MCR8536592.1 hypothetical protein [Prochlorococcus marinus XMU1424]